MLRLARRLQYRDRVLDHLGALLIWYPSGRQFFKDFPGQAEIRGDFEAGVAAQRSALRLAKTIIEDLVAQLDQSGRSAVAAALGTLDMEELRAIASDRVAGGASTVKDRTAFIAQLIGAAIFMGADDRGRDAWRRRLCRVSDGARPLPSEGDPRGLGKTLMERFPPPETWRG